MRRVLVLTLAMLLALGAGVASADVFVFADIEKFKFIQVDEDVLIVKVIDITSTVEVNWEKAAQSDVVVNQANTRNIACTNCDEKADLLTNSVNSNAGVVDINQAAGNMNNQANAIAIAVDVIVVPGGDGVPPPAQAGVGFADAEASLEQRNGGFEDETSFGNTVELANLLFRDALIQNSLNNNTGVIHVNQSPGNMYNQANLLSVAVSLAGGVALSEADLGQLNVDNAVFESDATCCQTVVPRVGINKRADILASVNDNVGIVGVNQGAGNMGNQANVVGVAATLNQ